MDRTAEGQNLALLLKVNSVLSSSLSLEEVMANLIEEVIEALRAERGFLVLLRDGEWKTFATHYLDQAGHQPEFSFSRFTVEHVARSGVAMLSLDALQSQPSPSVLLQGIRSVVCAPLRWNGQVRGVVYADSRVRSNLFKEPHVQVLSAIADQASRALETADLHEQLRKVHQRHLAAAKDAEPSERESQAGKRTVDFALGRLEEGLREQPSSVVAKPSRGVAISVFGSFQVLVDGQPIQEWSTRKNRDLLIYLATRRGLVVHEEKLMDLFWSQGGKKGLHSLHNGITQLRKALGDSRRQLLRRKLDGYTLGSEVWVDLDEFRGAFQAGQEALAQRRWDDALLALQRAEALADGDFLPGIYDDWASAVRDQLSRQMVVCRGLLADHFSKRGKHLVAVELWKRVLKHDNCHEEAYRGLLQAYRALRRPADAVRLYQACVQAFEAELDLPPPQDLAALLEFE